MLMICNVFSPLILNHKKSQLKENINSYMFGYEYGINILKALDWLIYIIHAQYILGALHSLTCNDEWMKHFTHFRYAVSAIWLKCIIIHLRIYHTFDFSTFIELAIDITFDIIIANIIMEGKKLAMIPYYFIPNFFRHDINKVGHSSNYLYQSFWEVYLAIYLYSKLYKLPKIESQCAFYWYMVL